MKKVLIPVDLKHKGDIALSIAKKLIDKQTTEIVLLHVIPAPNEALLLEDGSIKEDSDFDFSSLKEKANRILDELNGHYMQVSNISVEVIIGDINQVILAQTNTGNFDLLIMEMESYITKGFWSESHSEHISKHANIPILTLKCDRSSIDLTEIVFVSDFLTDNKLDLQVLRDLCDTFNSKVTLLKVVTEDQRRKDEEIIETAEKFALKNGLQTYQFKIQKGITIEDGIAKYCEINKVDLIAIGTNQRDGFSTLFRRSISQSIVKKLYHPIVTFPIR